MKTARRYLATEIYRHSAVVLLALVGLFSFFAVVDDLDQVGRGGFKLYHLIFLEVLALPTRVYDILPIGLLIGAILALAGLAQRHELVILRVSGVSGMRLLGMLWLVSVPVMVLALVLAEWLTPAAEIKLNETKLTITGSAGGRSSGMLRSGYWFKEDTQTGERIINVGGLQAGGGAVDVTLYEFTPEKRLASVVVGSRGNFGTGELQLEDVTVTSIAPDLESSLDAGTRPQQAPVVVSKEARRAVATTLTPELLLARVLTPERMSFSDLFDYVGYLNKNHLVSDRQIVAIWRKLIYPFTLLAMITIAAPVGFMQTRRGGVGLKMFVGILLGVAFFMLNQLSLNVGMLNRWPAWVTAVAPNALALGIALLAVLSMEYGNSWRARMARR
ncbi:Lipopolysaccharide export system permease protein LptG [Pigmentiphaga humi]|uniref:Lipopolysaccharide export system permease protein LptG n=1 Tax=Pigmentiphaga humi TaxID=2478468 RepID=A0A3P4B4L2_9BURK|nr:LPS export ABC transporter permease LptG [Pigmentiphaga humi]VCU70095.1 Lipopolysaccharide export system permease protein LptG [Pigmentiphaga humi]